MNFCPLVKKQALKQGTIYYKKQLWLGLVGLGHWLGLG